MFPYFNLVEKSTNKLWGYCINGPNGNVLTIVKEDLDAYLAKIGVTSLRTLTVDSILVKESTVELAKYNRLDFFSPMDFYILTQDDNTELSIEVFDQLAQRYKKSYKKEKRDVFDKILTWIDHDFMDSTISNICSICGLRRTGKTIMCEQLAYYSQVVSKKHNAASLVIKESCSIKLVDLLNILRLLKHLGFDLFICDEITYINDSFSKLQEVADIEDFGLVLSGTNSLLLEAAAWDTLFGRTLRISTSLIHFKEWKKLMQNDSVESFLQMGGILYADSDYKTAGQIGQIVYLDKSYIDTAYVENLQHSVLNSNDIRKSNHKKVYEQYMADKDLFHNYFYKRLMDSAQKLVLDSFNDVVDNCVVGSALQLLKSESRLSRGKLNILKEQVKNKTSYNSYINNKTEYTIDVLNEIESLLEDTEIVYSNGSKDYLLPFGLKYILLTDIFKVIDSMSAEFEEANVDINLFIQKMQEDMEGRLLEDLVRLELNTFRYVDCLTRRNNRLGIEIDIVVNGKYYMEVKRSKVVHFKQVQWMLCDYVSEKPLVLNAEKDMYVLYLGEDFDESTTFRIWYMTNLGNISIAYQKIIEDTAVIEKYDDEISIHYRNIEKFLLELQRRNVKDYFESV